MPTSILPRPPAGLQAEVLLICRNTGRTGVWPADLLKLRLDLAAIRAWMVTAVTAGELKRIGVAPSGRPSTMRMSRHRGTTVQSSPGRPPGFTGSSLRDGPRSAFPEKCAACSAAHQGRSSPAGSLFHAGHRVRRVRPAISAPVKPAHRQRALPILAPLFRCRESDRPMPPPAHGRGNSRQADL